MNGRADRFRVLVTAGWYPTEGSPFSGVFIREQAEALAESCDVAVIFVEIGERLSPPRLRQEGPVPVVRASLPRARLRNRRLGGYLNLATMTVGYGLAVLWSYALLRRRWGRPDVVHGHVLYPGGYAAWLAHKVARVPYVVTEHSAEILPSVGGSAPWGYGRSLARLVQRVARRATRLISVSTYLAKALVERGLGRDITIVPNAVRACPHPSVHSSSDCRHVVHVSLMVDKAKNISGLLRAVSLLREQRQDFKLLLVGDGPDRRELEAYAAEIGLDATAVEFTGALAPEEVMECIVESDFMVVSSRYETFCVAAAEALMCGRPVLSTRCGGPEDFITPAVGVLVAPEDESALASGLGWMIENCRGFDPEVLRGYAMSRFSSAVVTRSLVKVYREVLGVAGPVSDMGRR